MSSAAANQAFLYFQSIVNVDSDDVTLIFHQFFYQKNTARTQAEKNILHFYLNQALYSHITLYNTTESLEVLPIDVIKFSWMFMNPAVLIVTKVQASYLELQPEHARGPDHSPISHF